MTSPLLEVDAAVVTFGGLRAVDGATLAVARGAIVGLIGPNGAGKTTCFNSISGLQPLSDGRIRFGGADITKLPAHARATLGIGRSFQHLGLMMEETALTNVMAAQHLGARYRGVDVVLRPWRVRRRERELRRRAVRALAAFGLEDAIDTAVKDMSFGAARFVELAAVLVEDPVLMLLDEPTTGLDVSEIDTLRQALAAVRAGGTTILVIAHDVGFVMGLCDHVYVLAQGRVLSEGPPDTVRNDPAVIEAYLGVPA